LGNGQRKKKPLFSDWPKATQGYVNRVLADAGYSSIVVQHETGNATTLFLAAIPVMLALMRSGRGNH
jgi:hypothetical protein